jgi:hypothetical protein
MTLAASVVMLAGCGGDEIDGEVTQDQATALNATLAAVESAVDTDQCEAAQSQVDQFVEQVDGLPAEAGEELKNELRDAATHLEGLIDTECTPPTTTTPPEETTTTAPPEDTTTTTTTTATEPPEDTTTTTDEEPPNGDSSGPGGGNGGTGDGGGGDD